MMQIKSNYQPVMSGLRLSRICSCIRVKFHISIAMKKRTMPAKVGEISDYLDAIWQEGKQGRSGQEGLDNGNEQNGIVMRKRLMEVERKRQAFV